MWLLYAFISAFFASLVAIFGKLGLKSIDPTLATTIRGIIMAVFLFVLSFSIGNFNGFSLNSLSSRDWILIALSAIAGAMSWLFYFVALKDGPASAVGAIDRLSIVFIVVLAVVFLGESFGFKTAIGAALISIGAILITLK